MKFAKVRWQTKLTKNRLGLNKRFLLIQIPALVATLTVAGFAWKTRKTFESRTEIQELNELSHDARFYFSEFGRSLKASILDTRDERDFARQARAHDAVLMSLKRLNEVTDDADIRKEIGRAHV